MEVYVTVLSTATSFARSLAFGKLRSLQWLGRELANFKAAICLRPFERLGIHRLSINDFFLQAGGSEYNMCCTITSTWRTDEIVENVYSMGGLPNDHSEADCHWECCVQAERMGGDGIGSAWLPRTTAHGTEDRARSGKIGAGHGRRYISHEDWKEVALSPCPLRPRPTEYRRVELVLVSLVPSSPQELRSS
jgi:hypothetical protein